jgi:hypothetical protein
MREAWQRISGTGYKSLEAWILSKLDRFLRDRDRPDRDVAERLLELAPVAVLGGAFESAAKLA